MAMNACLVRIYSCDMAGFEMVVKVWTMTKGGMTACLARTPTYIEVIRIKENRWITIRMFRELINTDKKAICTIIFRS